MAAQVGAPVKVRLRWLSRWAQRRRISPEDAGIGGGRSLLIERRHVLDQNRVLAGNSS